MAIEPMTVELASATPNSSAFGRWEALMQQTYVPLAIAPYPDLPFYGRVATRPLAGADDCHLTALAGTNHEFRRSKSHIADSDEQYLLAGIQLRGRARLNQDGRSVLLRPGEMTFFDTSRPYRWSDGALFEQVNVQVPIRLLRALPGLGQLAFPTAVAVSASSAAGVVANYFRNLARIQEEAPDQADVLAAGAVELFGSAVLLAAGAQPVDTPADALSRERVLVFMRENFTNPELTADEVAHTCHISRRTLFRIFHSSGDSLNTTLRKMRVEHAKELLLRHRSRPPAAVAFGSGFASERHFYRVFLTETGMTPGEYRQSRIS
ncbi:helix-turn-helix domain-containing protein [Nocardia asteroides]|uniref:helix-turn-helix domain-containing protein n=1 Tax=Nocardia asteroides TaxID=1824 RepID=UPI001E42191D|nr:helix-turn-helix domain-containing protein [Nocardia asteroides]UGT53516.1 helix-turn-helix domain-containing protein [Nocardia asteroides]